MQSVLKLKINDNYAIILQLQGKWKVSDKAAVNFCNSQSHVVSLKLVLHCMEDTLSSHALG